jgi:hypothetical protein
VKTLAIALIATVALLSAATAVRAESPTDCTPTVEATDAGEVACASGEPEELEEAEEQQYEEAVLEEVALEEVRSVLAPSATPSEPAPTGESAPPPKLIACRRAPAAAIRAEAKRIRKLKGKRRRNAERRLDHARCR